MKISYFSAADNRRFLPACWTHLLIGHLNHSLIGQAHRILVGYFQAPNPSLSQTQTTTKHK
jgi:hypothetical protein